MAGRPQQTVHGLCRRLHGLRGESAPSHDLEQFAQCPYQYFLGRELRLKALKDAGDDLDALETGSTIHAAFAEAAREVIAGKDGAVWDLTYAPNPTEDQTRKNKESKVKEIPSLLLPRVSGALGDLARQQPTLCEPLLSEVGRRWGQAIRNWAEMHMQERIPVCLDDEAIDASPPVAAALVALATATARCQAVFEAFAGEVRGGGFAGTKKAAGEWAGRLSDAGGGKSKGAIQKLLESHLGVLKTGIPAEVGASLATLNGECVECAVEKARVATDKARQDERDRRSRVGAARKVAFAELSFGRGKDPESDPHSLPEPWEAECPGGRKVLVTGQVDRIDWDDERKALAIRDYKSGKKKPARRLLSEMREGLHLQLLLYGCAVEDVLVRQGRIPHLAGHRVRDVALEFPKEASVARADFSEEVPFIDLSAASEGTGSDTPSAARTTWREIGLTWPGCLTSAIEEGRFDLVPQRCPSVTSSAYCDFERICRFSPEHAKRFEADQPRPSFSAPEEKTKKKGDSKPPSVIAPLLSAGSSDPARDREVHRRGQEMAADLDHDVIVSAGVGTGKTWNLVCRYLGALDAGVAPEETLCVTFTRQAAAEMRQRVRAGLLERAAKAGEGSLPSDLRAKILTLSAAPIWTLDSQALHLLQALHDAQGDGAGKGSSPAVDPAGASAELEQFLSDRFLQALTDGDEDVRFLMDHVSVGCLRNEIRSVIGNACGVPRHCWSASPADVLASWESLLGPLVAKMRARIGGLDLDEWERCIEAEGGVLSPENVEKMWLLIPRLLEK